LAGQTNSYGAGSYDMWLLKLQDTPMKIENHNQKPAKTFRLYQNFPNPFNPSTLICYYMPYSDVVKLTLYDINGREVETIVNKRIKAGQHTVQFGGEKLATGLYFYKIQTSTFSDTKKLLKIN